MGIFDGSPRAKREALAALRRLRRPWWETAQAFDDDELYYDPADSIFDPLGSYTGRPADGGLPQQDADDL